MEINFICPTPSGGGIHNLSNFGNRIAGFGTETIAGAPAINSPFFSYSIPAGSNFPSKISAGSYASSGTDFDNITGIVSCSYTSSGGFDPFTVSYMVTNGNGGVIDSQTLNSITINQYLGFTS